ncbi:MAG: hypothetical protein HOV94_39650 [Saccharothrix sp.]|nr:hypothetical protein [Saccharothrix sp.]
MARVLPVALTALLLLTPTAQAAPDDQVTIASVGMRGTALSATTQGGAVTLQRRTGGPDQLWRVHLSDDGRYAQVYHDRTRSCLTAYTRDEVKVLECIGTQSQSWIRQDRPNGSRALENAAYPGECLTARAPSQPVVVRTCVSGDDNQAWKW